jgi:hypothetical protein
MYRKNCSHTVMFSAASFIKASPALRLIVALLLALSSLRVADTFESPAGQYLQKNPLTELLIPAVLGEAVGFTIANRQTRFTSSDGFCKDALAFNLPSAHSIRRSPSFLYQFNHWSAQSADPKILAGRAPPAV